MTHQHKEGFTLIEVILIIVVLGAIGFGAYTMITRGNDGSSSQNTEESADETPAETFEVVESYDYAQVCDGAQPTNVKVSTGDDKRIGFFVEKENLDRFVQQYAYTDAANRIDSDNPQTADLIGCLEVENNSVAEVNCDFESDSATMIRPSYLLKVYNPSTMEVVNSQTVPSDSECPMFATVKDGKFTADVNEDELEKVAAQLLSSS